MAGKKILDIRRLISTIAVWIRGLVVRPAVKPGMTSRILFAGKNIGEGNGICAELADRFPDCIVEAVKPDCDVLQKARADECDVIILAPGTDHAIGLELCRRLKSDATTKNIPVIMLDDASQPPNSGADAFDAGADVFIAQPFDALQLSAHVRTMLRMKHAEDELRREKDRLARVVEEKTQQLRASEEIYRSVFRIAAHLITSVDADGIIVDCNDSIRHVLGYEREEIIGHSVARIIHPDYMDKARQALSVIPTKGSLRNCEYQMVRKDGRIIDVIINSSGLTDRKGRYVRTICVVTDVTEQKRFEREREKLLAQLQSRNKELERIVYVASHDLRSPLVNIKGFSGELLKSCREFVSVFKDERVPIDIGEKMLGILLEDIPESLDFICASAARMDLLLRGLLKISRFATQQLDLKPLDINRMVADIAKSMEFRVRQADTRIRIDKLPDCMGDELQVQQVFTNLLANAVNYLDPSRPGVIELFGHIDDGRCIYAVRDNGIGIAPEHQEKIFEIFYRLDPGDAAGGEGLGLSIVRRIVDRHDGRVWLESEPAKGSTFYVALPAIPAAVTKDGA